MAMAASLACFLISLSSFSALSVQPSFDYHGFNDSNLVLDSRASVLPSGVLRLTDNSHDITGHAFRPIDLKMIDNSGTSPPRVFSFNTSFVFAIVSNNGPSGYGLAFVLAPSTNFSGADSGHFLGLFNSKNNGNASNHILAVEFDTLKGQDEAANSKGNHIGININNITSVKTKPARYYIGDEEEEEAFLDSGNPIQAWVEYDGLTKHLNVSIAPAGKQKPTRALISEPLNNLSSVLKETMFAGFSASTGKETSFHYITGWSFAINEAAPPLNISQLPTVPPREEDSSRPSSNPLAAILVAALSSVTLLGIVLLGILYKRRLNSESLEEWEKDCPHRFNYTDLHRATNGFKDTHLVGRGGFGLVYKGVLHSTGSAIAVKKVTRNSSQGMREFAAEIESLGRLRHKNLVNLQGWCKKKNDLLLVYDYIPNGSLYSLLYHPNGNLVLNWEQRLNILKSIAAGLLYLHEEWERVVIHRDIKPSNVLIDADMNARLSDFGLARLYDHDQVSHTTSVVGTIGYISPELARTGKASKTTDVFAYGVMVLEMACGRKPLESDLFILVDWVMECYEKGGILDAADPKLNGEYEMGEMEMVLQLGLLCSHQKPEARPTMRQVSRYLRGEEQIVPIDLSNYSQYLSESNSGFSQFISKNLDSSSTGLISTTSLGAGR